MADATAIISRYPKFPKRKSLDLSLLTTSSSQSLRKRPQNLGLKSMPMKNSIEGTIPKRECLKICETDSSIEYDKRGPAEIRPYLFLGSQEHACKQKTLHEFKIDAILNVTREVANFFPNEFEYHNCPVTDETSTDIYTIFEACFSFIDKIRQSGRRVLVHCYAGVSRSTTICVAYLMRTEGLKYEAAMDWVRKCRPVVAPNLGFLGQLMEYETRGFNTMDPPNEPIIETRRFHTMNTLNEPIIETRRFHTMNTLNEPIIETRRFHTMDPHNEPILGTRRFHTMVPHNEPIIETRRFHTMDPIMVRYKPKIKPPEMMKFQIPDRLGLFST